MFLFFFILKNKFFSHHQASVRGAIYVYIINGGWKKKSILKGNGIIATTKTLLNTI